MLYALKELVGNDVEKDLEKFGHENAGISEGTHDALIVF